MLVGLIILIATLAVYAPVKHYDFADVDDAGYITENLHIKYGLDWDAVKWSFTTYYLANWHPLTWLSHGLDCQLFRLNAGRHHDVNVLLHGLNAVVLFWVLAMATGYAGRSAMVAALFALHPINVESVVWIAERKNVLSLLFFLLALGAYRWYAEHPQVLRYLLVALLFALGLMAKPQVITLPFVLLLWDYWPLQRIAAKDAVTNAAIPTRNLSWLVLEKLPLLALSAISAVLTVRAQRAGGAMNALNAFSFRVRINNAVVSYVRYIGKAIWPSRLAAFYPYSHGSVSVANVVACSLLLAMITVLVIAARGRRYLLVGWFWFLGTTVPMIGIVQVGDQSMADRYAYLPFIGLFIMVSWGVADVVSTKSAQRASTRWLLVPSLAVLVILAVLTRHQIEYWKNSVTLWTHAVEVTKENDAAETYLGQALLRRSDAARAIPHFQRAIAIFPAGPKAYMFLGYAEQQNGDPKAAIQNYQRALDLAQNYGKDAAHIRSATLESMAYAYRDIGDLPRAAQCLEEAQQSSQSQAEINP